MRDYEGWIAKEQPASFAETKAAIAAGIIPSPTKGNRCGKTTGRIDYHNHDYSDPIKYLNPLCQGCHIKLHRLKNKALADMNSSGINTIVTTQSESVRSFSVAVDEVIEDLRSAVLELFVCHIPSPTLYNPRCLFLQSSRCGSYQ